MRRRPRRRRAHLLGMGTGDGQGITGRRCLSSSSGHAAPGQSLSPAETSKILVTEPAVGRVLVVAGVPVHGLGQRGHGHRQRHRLEPRPLGFTREESLEHGDQTGPGHHMGGHGEAPDIGGDPEPGAHAVEVGLHDRGHRPVHPEKRQPPHLLDGDGVPHPGVVLVDSHHELVGEQRLAEEAGQVLGKTGRPDQQIALAPAELVDEVGLRGEDVDAGVPRPRLHFAQNGPDQHRLGVVAGDHGECAGRAVGGIERPARAHDGPHRRKGLLRRPHQRLGQRGQGHPPPLPHEQRIPEVTPQPGERGAHRRLSHEDPLGRPGHTAFGQQSVQGDENVEIDIAKVVRHVCAAFPGDGHARRHGARQAVGSRTRTPAGAA